MRSYLSLRQILVAIQRLWGRERRQQGHVPFDGSKMALTAPFQTAQRQDNWSHAHESRVLNEVVAHLTCKGVNGLSY